jgi:methenyltetrahydrofolate cyclohydrolase
MPTLTALPFRDLLAAFRSSSPTPGGGSASALAGAVGSSLLTMVASLPKPRAASEGDVERLAAAGARSARLADELTALVDADSDAYDAVVAAYRLPKDTDDQKRRRQQTVQEALRGAIDTPLRVMRACGGAIEQAAVVAAMGNANASSDVRVALELLMAGLRGARLNVEINLASLKDADYAGRVADEASQLTIEAERGVAAAQARLM